MAIARDRVRASRQYVDICVSSTKQKVCIPYIMHDEEGRVML